MNTSTKYNGYQNYPTWCVALWLSNDQGSYEYWRDAARQCVAAAPDASQVNAGIWTAVQAAKYALADRLKASFDEANPLDKPDVWSDLLGFALDAVNWHEVAENILDEVTTLPGGSSTETQPQPGADASATALVVDLSQARFSLGLLGATPGALAAVSPAEMTPALARHLSSDWGLVCAHDRQANNQALVDQSRLLSVYETAAGTRFWIITEADRSSTTVLLPEEY